VTGTAGLASRLTNRQAQAFCWAHWRRQWFDLAKSPPAPIAAEALERIASLYRIESEIRGSSADERRTARQERSKPVTSAMKAWLEKTLAQVPGGSTLAQIIRYSLSPDHSAGYSLAG
jgi:transposase